MKIQMKTFAMVVLLLSLAACGGSKITTFPTNNRASVAVNTIALNPSGGLMANAVGIELAGRGYNVVDTSQVSQILYLVNMNETQVSQPPGLRLLADQGIDALLSVSASVSFDGQPQAASARVSETRSGAVIAGATWQNGWGGVQGSIADRTMRKGLNEAAAEIASAIALQLR